MANKFAVGIDLGTTNCCVAVFSKDVVEIVTNRQGNRTTPSYVAFMEQRLIGDPAKDQAAINPEQTVFDSKRLIGRTYDDPVVQADLKLWPFEVIEKDSHIKIKVQSEKGVEMEYFPEEISSMILAELKTFTEEFIGESLKDVVITVPAYFNNSQRQSTKDAATMAGLNALKIINEPTAAALAYGFSKVSSDEKNILVFDLGGGTLDVSLLAINNKKFDVKSVSGDTHLGGNDFDNAMVKHFLKEFQTNNQVDISQNKRAIRRLRTACEKAKKMLSSGTQASIDLDCFHNGIDLRSKINRARFDALNYELFEKCLDVVKACLTGGNIDKDKIDEIVLVGGSTRIPKIRSILEDFFGGKKLNHTQNPDESIAYGAAIQAAKLQEIQAKEISEIFISDVTPLSLGVASKDGVMSVVIQQNTNIPTKKTKLYSTVVDNQECISIRVFEGQHCLAEENNLLAEFELNDIPRGPRGEILIEVTFEIDQNGILHVSAVEKSTKKGVNIKIINHAGHLTSTEIEEKRHEIEEYYAQQAKRELLIELKNQIVNKCYSIKSRISKDDTCEEQRKSDVIAKCHIILDSVDSDDTIGERELKQFENQLNQLYI